MNIEVLTLPEVRDVYRQQLIYDFPDDERKPLSRIEETLKEGRYLCCGIRDESGVAAYAFFVVIEKHYLIDYFAVRKDLRGTGIGSAFLKELGRCKLQNASCVLAEVDDPACADSDEDRTIRERRLSFYLKNGLRNTGAKARAYGVCFLILEIPLGDPHTREEAEEIYSRIYRAILPERIYTRMIKIL